MSPAASARPWSGARAGDWALVALAIGLAAFTAIVASVPTVAPAIVNDRLDVAIQTSAALVAFSVAGLSWARARVDRDAAALLRGSAFAVLCLLNTLTLGVMLAGADAAVGGSLVDPGQLPLWANVIARGTAALLLVVAGIAATRATPPVERPGVLLLAPAAMVAAALVIAALLQDQLPPLADEAALDALVQVPAMPITPGTAPALILVQGVIGLAFFVAALAAHRTYRTTGRAGQGLLSAGLLIAAISQLHSAIHPGSYVSFVTTADLLRLAFYAVLLVGTVIDSRDDLRALREANVEVRRLAEAQLASVALEERARMAREIHDGLAQDLWYAKLKQSRLAQLVPAGSEATTLSDEVGDAIDAALSEARQAVVAMRPGGEPGNLPEMIERQVDDFADRFAIRAETTVSGPVPDLEPRRQAEVLRIVQEALTNVRKHADATVVRVTVETDGDLRVTIADNGRGFRPDVPTGGFGLESMRQRAELIGADLSVVSAPQDGTRVELRLPVAATREERGEP